MALARALQARVPFRIRQRGSDLNRARRVEILEGDEAEVSALVRGGKLYSVRMQLNEDALQVFCECPFFSQGADVCKHIWAALLAADEAGLLSSASEQAGLDLSAEDDPFFPPLPQEPSIGDWAARLSTIGRPDSYGTAWRKGREIFYVIDAMQTRSTGRLTLSVFYHEAKRDGSWGQDKVLNITASLVAEAAGLNDNQILAMLLGSPETTFGLGSYQHVYGLSGARMRPHPSIAGALIPLVAASGRGWLSLSPSDKQLVPLAWDGGPPWQLCLVAHLDEPGANHVVGAMLERGGERMPVDEPELLLGGGFVFSKDGTVARLDDGQAFGWISSIRSQGEISIPLQQTDAFLESLVALPHLPKLDLPPELSFGRVRGDPRPRLQIRGGAGTRAHPRLKADLFFEYEGHILGSSDRASGVYLSQGRLHILRDPEAESEAARTLGALGVRLNAAGARELLPKLLPKVVRTLTGQGWHVEAEGKLYKTAGSFKLEVRSGIDWFDLSGEASFGGSEVALPELLAALRRGDHFVPLDDGSFGLLPQEWLERYALLAGTASVEGNALRFKRTQVGLLDALLASQPEASFDETFTQARDKLAAFDGIEPAAEPPGFAGELRTYQRDGLGWLHFLRGFGFGGCLADDMGLGKTVQVLALLETRRDEPLPSLVVVPKSLVFNWYEEAKRFAPQLDILQHTGARLAPGDHFQDHDVILTTYGTLRRDAPHLTGLRFDYCILDEAQAIKNASTASAKAARLVKADHRLALSGTPIENHLGELWSLFEFLNPGMLGTASVFASGLANGSPRGTDQPDRSLIAKALRPFILRRTKDQVATDLPPKTEQTLYCELQGAQRKHYDQLRAHYRRDLMGRVERDGISKSKIFVLEALLRLRQAALHPGLIDKAKTGEPSAKLDLLIPQLVEVAGEGHKALVFSQFTQMLAIVRNRLDREKIPYEYLDGRTRDRQAKVERFQSDPGLKLFLISLKAGGLGLNLTAAEYVFLLDPWWNPAVEAQAIDRTHRIGQTRPVFAYRIIAKDTVEEKVLELQRSKRALADEIISADNALIRHIGREDLDLLLS